MADMKCSEECTDKDNTDTAVACIPSAVSKLINFTSMQGQSATFRGRGEYSNLPIPAELFVPAPMKPSIRFDEGPTETRVREKIHHCEESLTYDEKSQHKVQS